MSISFNHKIIKFNIIRIKIYLSNLRNWKKRKINYRIKIRLINIRKIKSWIKVNNWNIAILIIMAIIIIIINILKNFRIIIISIIKLKVRKRTQK